MPTPVKARLSPGVRRPGARGNGRFVSMPPIKPLPRVSPDGSASSSGSTGTSRKKPRIPVFKPLPRVTPSGRVSR